MAEMSEFESKNHSETHGSGPHLLITTRENLTNLIENLSKESGMSVDDITNEMLKAGSSVIALNIRKGISDVHVMVEGGKYIGAKEIVKQREQ